MVKAAVVAAKRQLQLDGYTAFLRALAANDLNWKHEKIMHNVRTELSITQEQHLAVIEQVTKMDLSRHLRIGEHQVTY
eukprot:scaffold418007_cov33-Prasinocladus_malaysianus.AAC.1